MNLIGNSFLALAWALSLLGFFAGAIGGKRGDERYAASARNAAILVGIFSWASLAVLAYGFVHDDYRNQYIWQFSNRDMSDIYKVTAIWGGMDGSMLLWAAFGAAAVTMLAFRSRYYPLRLRSWLFAVLHLSTGFFLTVVLFLTNPFRFLQSHVLPLDGNGLNPLLQNPYMAIHPPTLYVGFTTLAIPYAFCMAALLSNQLSNDWIRLTRRWTLIAWGFLTFGIVLGGYWAYIELGWGGFWAWDPVENASFFPWLTATAFLHSVMIQERKGMLKLWNIWLIVLTYALTVFGTFLTRSGVVQSVHAFASTDIGWVFLLYLGLVIGAALVLSFIRRKALRSERSIESIFSREAAFLMNNLVFLSICFATLWGVMFPVLSEAFTGEKQTVSIPYFNAVNVPLFLLLLFLMGVGPLIAWRKASLSHLKQSFLLPALLGFFAGLCLLWAGIDSFYAVLSYSLCFFVFLTILGELHRGHRAQRLASPEKGALESAATLLRRHHIRYGAYLIHFGVLVAAIGITASMAHKTEEEFSLSLGESFEVGRYVLTLKDFHEERKKNYDSLQSLVELRVRGTQSPSTVLRPELRLYTRNNENTTEVAIRKSLRDDVYLVLAGLDDSGQRAAFKVYINPLQNWLWIGVLIMGLGTLIVLIPKKSEQFRANRKRRFSSQETRGKEKEQGL